LYSIWEYYSSHSYYLEKKTYAIWRRCRYNRSTQGAGRRGRRGEEGYKEIERFLRDIVEKGDFAGGEVGEGHIELAARALAMGGFDPRADGSLEIATDAIIGAKALSEEIEKKIMAGG
jgi:hypothetical protein